MATSGWILPLVKPALIPASSRPISSLECQGLWHHHPHRAVLSGQCQCAIHAKPVIITVVLHSLMVLRKTSRQEGGVPESRNKLSIRPRRFSRPSMYFALDRNSHELVIRISRQDARRPHSRHEDEHSPLRRIPFLLNLCKDAVRLVVDAMCTCWQLSIALDFLLSAHVASL